MYKYAMSIFTTLFLVTIGLSGIAEAQTMDDTLNKKQQSVIAISAFTANGDLDNLKTALNEGLDAQLTINEIKEIFIQMYAYTGFPRSLNGIHVFMDVMDERQKKGIKDEIGREATPVPADMNKDEYGANVRARLAGQVSIPPASGYQLFTPTIDTFLKEHLFADIFARDILDYQTRELATISALAAMSGTSGQLQFHLGAALNTGLTEQQIEQFIHVIEKKIGNREADIATSVFEKVMANRK